MSVDVCTLAVAVVLVGAFCDDAAGKEGFGMTQVIAGAVIDICCSVVVSAARA